MGVSEAAKKGTKKKTKNVKDTFVYIILQTMSNKLAHAFMSNEVFSLIVA